MTLRPDFSTTLHELSGRRDHIPGFDTKPSYVLTRYSFLRALGLVYCVAFLGLVLQLRPLLGHNGLLPVQLFLQRVEASLGNGLASYLSVPTLLWIDAGDGFMMALAWVGLALSVLLVCGYANALQMLALWVLYSSFVHTGQLFYSYGWETLLLETGFLAVFLCPLFKDGWSLQDRSTDRWILLLLRWVLFRVMFGAGLIKLRGDPCWLDLSCLLYHYQTQPIPNPLSWYLHQAPEIFHKGGVVFNHVVELIAPWFLFGPRRLRHVGALLIITFQMLLIVSGNLSWLNYITLALCIPCLSDGLLLRIAPTSLRQRPLRSVPASRARRITTLVLLALIAVLSIGPIGNMWSSRQRMNTSFDRLNLVNSYGAFGSVGRQRREIIILGTTDPELDAKSEWRAYEFKCKPGDPNRRPCVVSPYHYRLDWQIWFAAMSDYSRQPWFVHLVYKLLQADVDVLSLLDSDPFDGVRPAYIRADLYEYEFTDMAAGGWWKRRRLGAYLPAVSLDNPALINIIGDFGWPLYETGDEPPSPL
jgi:hypothetical protein